MKGLKYARVAIINIILLIGVIALIPITLYAQASETSSSETASTDKNEAKKEGYSSKIDFFLAAQYPYITGDEHKLLENEGTKFQPGFLLDHFSFKDELKNRDIINLNAGVFLPINYLMTDGNLSLSYRIPGKLIITGKFKRFNSFYDDSIASDDIAKFYFPNTAELDEDIFKGHDNGEIGVKFTPDTQTSVSLSVGYSGEHGKEIPLAGSEFDTGNGHIFAYPGKNEVSNENITVRWGISRWISLLDLSLNGSYNMMINDRTFTTTRLQQSSFEGKNEYSTSFTGHALSNEAKVSITPSGNTHLMVAYGLAYGRTNPSFEHRLGNVLRIDSTNNEGFGILRHIVPITFQMRPVNSLLIKLQLTGLFANKKVETNYQEFTGGLEVLSAERNGKSELNSKSLREKFAISYSGLPHTTVELREELTLTDLDAYIGLLDIMSPQEDRYFDFVRKFAAISTEGLVSSKIIPSILKLELGAKYSKRWNAETTEDARDWIPFGDQEDWRMGFNAKLSIRLFKKLTMLTGYNYTLGRVWRPEQIEQMDDADMDASTHSFIAGLVSTPCKYFSIILNYQFNHGLYEVGPSPLLSIARTIRYRATVNEFGGTIGLNPLSWWVIDGSYVLALVSGNVETTIHRISAESLFAVHKNIKVGAGYMGRIFSDDNASNDDYSGHLFRIVVKGEF